MAKKRRDYTEEFKREALELWKESGKSGTEIEEELGIGSGCLYRWRLERRAQEQAPEANGELKVARLRIKELEREVEILEQEREILKKAVTIFTRPSPSGISSSKSIETNTR